MAELYHYGVKGMKWGVRKDERAKIKAARKQTYDASRQLGADKYTSRKLAWQSERDVRSAITTNRAIDAVARGSKDAKQRAKDYQNAINLANRSAANQLGNYANAQDNVKFIDKRIEKLRNKPENVRRRKKIEALTTDSKLLKLSMREADIRYKQYKMAANQIMDKMSKDNAVVYRTRRRELGGSPNGNEAYSVWGTDYDVKKKTGNKREQKKFSDSNRKEYDMSVTKFIYY